MDIDEDTIKSELFLAAIGNPIVDTIVKLKDDSFFKKYNLQFDRSSIVDVNFLKAIDQDLKQRESEIWRSPGGCSQNTLRIFQWLMNSKFNCIMIGSIGEDDNGSFLNYELQKHGVLTSYSSKKDFMTALVFIFIYKNYTSFVYGTTSLASSQYSLNDLRDEKTLDSIKKAKFVLLEGFFVVHSDDVGREVLHICAEYNTPIAFNICDEYLVKSYTDIVITYIKSCQIVIGDRNQFKAVCDLLHIPTDNFEMALTSVHKLMKEQCILGETCKIKSMEEYKKILIVTCGSKPVYCISGNNNIIKYDVPIVEESKVKDVTGAGDSFLAGFLYGVIYNLPILKSLELACKVAAEIIQEYGCIVPQKSSATLLADLV